MYAHHFTQFISKVDQKLNQVKFESVRTLLKITHLTSSKSYLVIICLNSYEKLIKIRNYVKLELVQTLLKITPIASKSYIWPLFAPIQLTS